MVLYCLSLGFILGLTFIRPLITWHSNLVKLASFLEKKKKKETTYWKILLENKWALARQFSILTPNRGVYSDMINLKHASVDV